MVVQIFQARNRPPRATHELPDNGEVCTGFYDSFHGFDDYANSNALQSEAVWLIVIRVGVRHPCQGKLRFITVDRAAAAD
jgi:hypothetical protein